MPLTRKNTIKKRAVKTANGLNKETVNITKKTIPINEIVLPEKFQQLNDMLAKTTFIN